MSCHRIAVNYSAVNCAGGVEWVSDLATRIFMRVAAAIELTAEEQKTLTKYSRGRNTPAKNVLRAKVILREAERPKGFRKRQSPQNWRPIRSLSVAGELALSKDA